MLEVFLHILAQRYFFSVPQTAVGFGPPLILALAYELSGSIWAPISIHALFNASQLLVQEINFH